MNRSVLLLALVLILGPGCANWDTTRTEVVEPLDSLLHGDYTAAFLTGQAQAVVDLHSAAAAGDARANTELLLAGLERVDRSRILIREVKASDDREGAWEADCLLRIDGVMANGVRHTRSQEQRLTCERSGDRWRIVRRKVQPIREAPRSRATFVDEAAKRGLVFKHLSRGVEDEAGVRRAYFGGSGLAAADIDGDGLDDLLMVGGGDLRLFRNVGGTFVDETRARGIVTPPKGECRAAFFGDIDNDGDVDLFVAMLGADDLLFMNEGGIFRQVSQEVSGLISTGQTTSACFADFDLDGDLDLYVVSGMNLKDRKPDPIYEAKNGAPNHYFRNRGDGTFEEVTDEVGLADTGWGLACSITDYDLDGDSDLFVANDFGPDLLFRNLGDGTFEDVTEEAGLTYRTSSMSSDFNDLNGDGLPDLLISGMASNSRWALRMPGFPAHGPFPLNILIRGVILDLMWEMLHGNRFYLSQGDGTFREVSQESGLRDSEWGWGSVWLDYDQDGDLDLYSTNGFFSGEKDDDL